MSAVEIPMTGLRSALNEGRFVVTAELGPPRAADAVKVEDKAALLRGWVDAVNARYTWPLRRKTWASRR